MNKLSYLKFYFLYIFYAESLPVENIVTCQTLLEETFL